MEKFSTRYRVLRAVPRRGAMCAEIARRAFGQHDHAMRMRVRYHLLAMLADGQLRREGDRYLRNGGKQ